MHIPIYDFVFGQIRKEIFMGKHSSKHIESILDKLDLLIDKADSLLFNRDDNQSLVKGFVNSDSVPLSRVEVENSVITDAKLSPFTSFKTYDSGKLNFIRLSDTAKPPEKAFDSDAGYDLFTDHEIQTKPFETTVIGTGIAIDLPDGYFADVRGRSGITSKGALDVRLGTIDNGYKGEIKVIVRNQTPNHITIQQGTKLAQLVIHKQHDLELNEVDSFQMTLYNEYKEERNTNGFGSSGI